MRSARHVSNLFLTRKFSLDSKKLTDTLLATPLARPLAPTRNLSFPSFSRMMGVASPLFTKDLINKQTTPPLGGNFPHGLLRMPSVDKPAKRVSSMAIEEKDIAFEQSPAVVLKKMLELWSLPASVYKQPDGPSYPVTSAHGTYLRTVRLYSWRTEKEMEEASVKHTYRPDEIEEIRHYAKDLSIDELAKFFDTDLDYALKNSLFESENLAARANLNRIKILEGVGLYNKHNVTLLLSVLHKEKLVNITQLFCMHHFSFSKRQIFFVQMATDFRLSAYSQLLNIFKEMRFQHRWSEEINQLLIKKEDAPTFLIPILNILKFSIRFHISVEKICLSQLTENLKTIEDKAKILIRLSEILENAFSGGVLPPHSSIILHKIVQNVLADDKFMETFQHSLNTLMNLDEHSWGVIQSFPEVCKLTSSLSCSSFTLQKAPRDGLSSSHRTFRFEGETSSPKEAKVEMSVDDFIFEYVRTMPKL